MSAATESARFAAWISRRGSPLPLTYGELLANDGAVVGAVEPETMPSICTAASLSGAMFSTCRVTVWSAALVQPAVSPAPEELNEMLYGVAASADPPVTTPVATVATGMAIAATAAAMKRYRMLAFRWAS